MARRAKRLDVSIRALEPDDAAGFAKLQAMPGYRFGTLRTPYRTVAATRKFLERLPERDLLVGAFLGERLVGAAGLHRSEGRRSHAAWLGVGVADDVRGRGVGAQLMQALIAPGDAKAPPPENPMSADRVRWEHIQRVYELCNRNVSETARRLNMHRRTLQRILAKRAPK